MTIGSQNRECLFGDIVGNGVHLNAAGQMITKWWLELTNKFPTVERDVFIVMPNHVHGIIGLLDKNVGAALRGRSENENIDSN